MIRNSDEIVMICPGDFRHDIGSEIEMYKHLNVILSTRYRTRIIDFPRRTRRSVLHLPTIITMYTRVILGEKMKLLRTLCRAKGIVYASYLPIVLSVALVNGLTGRRFRVVAYISGLPVSSGPVVRFLHRLLAVTALRLCEGAIFEIGLALNCYSRFAKQSTYASLISFSPKALESIKLARTRCTSPSSSGRIQVGVIGPFHSANRPSIKYIIDNLPRFSENIIFVFIGDVITNDVVQSERMRFVGRVENLLDYLTTLDCVLIPRLFRTGAPMGKMIYAMAAGLPVVTNDAEGMKIRNGYDAVVGRIDELPEILNSLVLDRDRMLRIGLNALSFINQHNNSDESTMRVLRFFDDILGN